MGRSYQKSLILTISFKLFHPSISFHPHVPLVFLQPHSTYVGGQLNKQCRMNSALQFFSKKMENTIKVNEKFKGSALFGWKNSHPVPDTTRQTTDIPDTIFALSSGAGTKAGVSIIRVSGPDAQNVLERLTKPPSGVKQFADGKLPKPRMASVRRLFDPESFEMLDESLVLWFPGPGSFTGEDTVEFHVHGSRAVVAGVLEALGKFTPAHSENEQLQCRRVRMAERGEFTQRAFENGRMDLTEVEGLADLIAADTAVQRRQALRQMGGALRTRFEGWREELKRCLAHTEAVIDFADDEHDVSEGAFDALRPRIKTLLKDIDSHLSDGRKGEIIRTGVRVAILGPPNAGKSSLLNFLAQRPAAIVSPIAGTTRDVVEIQLDLGGLPVILSDTAGLRNTTDEIEVEGMRRARATAADAHLALFVADLTNAQASRAVLEDLRRGITVYENEKGLVHLFEEGSVIIVANKNDMFEGDLADMTKTLSPDQEENIWAVSCHSKKGMDELLLHIEQKIRERFENSNDEAPLITRERHRFHLQRASKALNGFLQKSQVLDLAAEELRFASQELGCIIGAIGVEEILDIIFKDFCIGK